MVSLLNDRRSPLQEAADDAAKRQREMLKNPGSVQPANQHFKVQTPSLEVRAYPKGYQSTPKGF
jgi:hypothetical protein